MAELAPNVPFVSTENSTTVRSLMPQEAPQLPPAPWPVRVAVAATSALAPAAAALVAERLFLTPPRHPAPAWERDALARGEPLVLDAAGARLRAWRFGRGPAVLLVHGWGGRAGQLVRFLEPLEDMGFSAVAFDAPAHGGSTGRFASAPVFASAIADVAGQLGARAVIAHSIGAAGLALAAASGLDVHAAVLLAPPRGPVEFFQAFCDALRLEPQVRERVRARLARRYGVPIEAYDLPGRLSAVTAPALVVHDRDDREVPWSDGEAIVRSWRGARLLTTTGLGHRRILREPAVIREVVRFLGATLRA